jgi:hypothetical protein
VLLPETAIVSGLGGRAIHGESKGNCAVEAGRACRNDGEDL